MRAAAYGTHGLTTGTKEHVTRSARGDEVYVLCGAQSMTGTRPEPTGDDSADFDRKFSEIVAGFEPSGLNPPIDPPTDTSRPTDLGEPSPDGGSWRTWEGDDRDDHFVPAPIDPLPAGDMHFWAIVVGLAVGPALIFLSAVVRVLPGMPWGLLGVAMTVAGFVLLVLRSPKRPSGDDGSGARV